MWVFSQQFPDKKPSVVMFHSDKIAEQLKEAISSFLKETGPAILKPFGFDDPETNETICGSLNKAAIHLLQKQ